LLSVRLLRVGGLVEHARYPEVAAGRVIVQPVDQVFRRGE
jgi:hypothetical protein